jgi:hypothetical protein
VETIIGRTPTTTGTSFRFFYLIRSRFQPKNAGATKASKSALDYRAAD